MDYIYTVVAAFASVHSATYGLWLIKQGNRAGALCVFCLALLCLGLPIYRLVAGGQ